MMNFEELDEKTRDSMLNEFNTEWARTSHYIPDGLNTNGLSMFPELMRKTIKSGTIESLVSDLSNPSYWKPSRTYMRKGNPVTQNINPVIEAGRLAHSEFTTLYTKGLTKRLLNEGEKECQVYRADMAIQPKCECTSLEESIIPLDKIYNGTRKKYFPTNDPTAFSIPSAPYCHHTIRRIKK